MENLQNIIREPEVLWFLVGLGLLIIELFGLSLIVGFFGLGAWVASLSVLLFDPGFSGQLWIFIVSSVVLLVVLRKFMKNQFFDGKLTGEVEASELSDEFIGQKVLVEKSIAKNKPGKVLFKGSLWTALSDEEIPQGEMAQVTAINSTQLTVKSL